MPSGNIGQQIGQIGQIGNQVGPGAGGIYQDIVISDGPIVAIVNGYWAEPAAPPPTTATLDLGQPQTVVSGLLLRANLPSTVTLTGPADLLFSSFSLRLTAQPLTRNLAKPEWGSARSITGEQTPEQEILLAAPSRIVALGVRRSWPVMAPAPPPVKVSYKDGGSFKTAVAALGLYQQITASQTKRTYSGYHQQALTTDSVRFNTTDEKADLLLASPSLPSRVGIALGDDTPAQLFPVEMEAGGTVTSRDLTGQINAAWRRGAPAPGGTATVQLRITSLTDGVIRIQVDGAWGRSSAGPEESLALDPVNPRSLTLPWPFASTADAVASLRVTGSLEGGRRVQLVGGPPGFHVRATERLEVAQAFQLATGSEPVAGRELLAVWLMLPRLPRAEERLELRLAEAVGDPPAPADEPLARMELALPVDAAAYVPEAGGFWYRAAFEKPLPLDGMQAIRPLFLVAAGREGGSLLAHRSQSVPPEAVQRAPAGAGPGVSLVRNLDRTGTWEVQPFNRLAAQWIMDLEVAPLPEEYPTLVSLAYGGQWAQYLPLAGGGRFALDCGPTTVQPAGGALTATLNALVRAGVKAQLFLYKPIKS